MTARTASDKRSTNASKKQRRSSADSMICSKRWKGRRTSKLDWRHSRSWRARSTTKMVWLIRSEQCLWKRRKRRPFLRKSWWKWAVAVERMYYWMTPKKRRKRRQSWTKTGICARSIAQTIMATPHWSILFVYFLFIITLLWVGLKPSQMLCDCCDIFICVDCDRSVYLFILIFVVWKS